MSDWASTSCIICSINCGLKVQTEGRRITALRGDREHPASYGYVCEKARSLDSYQNAADRLSSPLRRRADGTFEAIDWDTAIREVAAKLAAIRDEHGGDKIFYYGGGAQGNHLGGGYGRATRAALGSVFTSNALAQEKTGEFWVDGQLFGRARCHTAPDFEHAGVAVFVGKNPWQSHGFPRARVVLKQIAKDPERKMIVIDPRRSETAAMADIHLQVRPGADAWLLAALVAVLLQEDLIDDVWLAEHAVRLDELEALLGNLDIIAYCQRADVPEEQVRQAARVIGRAKSVSVLEDLGIQQAPHSETLGPTLPAGVAAAAAIWGLAQRVAMTYPDSVRRAGLEGEGPSLGNALFRKVMDSPSGLVFTDDPYEETWKRVETGDGRVNLVVDELRSLADTEISTDDEFPFVLAAGERRSDSANVLFRDPSWRKAGPGTLRLNPDDAARLGLAAGMTARVTTRRGTVVAPSRLPT